MSSPFLRLGAAVLLLTRQTLCAGQATGHFELDVIFPRNETYKPSEVFPIAFAIQNVTAARQLGDFEIRWDINPVSEAGSTHPTPFDTDTITGAGLDIADDTSVFVANSNVTKWIALKGRQETYVLEWSVHWLEAREGCRTAPYPVFGSTPFNVEGPGEADEADVRGVSPDVMKVPKCPISGSVVEIRPNARETSCSTTEEDSGREGNPCAVVVDEDVASSIASAVSSLAGSTATPTSTTDKPEDEDDAAGCLVPSMRTVIVAACIIGSLSAS